MNNIHHVIDEVFIRSAMEITNNNVSKAAKLLGINRNTLAKRLKHMGNGSFKKTHPNHM
ncbi:MAG: helix-turn-helix domain-containing protein [Syntrophorhabdaceae bacterium]|nr:helix-turn-helix domain-containing protein [Syntrophorhabdaceae bacterium]